MGGGVRDLLLRIAPKDFDVVTSAHPDEIRQLFRNSRLIGRRFRLAHIQFGREIIEVATYRASIPTEEHAEHIRNPNGMLIRDNVYGNLEQDVWRRDFTINALYYNIADASIVDYTGGFKDIQNKTIRLIGSPMERYKEDPVRMLRAIRFKGKLGFSLSTETAEAIKPSAHYLANVSNARLFDEVLKLYHNGQSQSIHLSLCEYDLFAYLFPQTAEIMTQNTQAQKLILQTLENTDNRINQSRPVTPAFLLAAMLWYPLQSCAAELQEQGIPALPALEKAMSIVVSKQSQSVSIPKRFVQVMREIWILQYRFPRRYGHRPYKILEHPRFRAAYDFLLIRALAGEEEVELADWWTEFQEVDENTRKQMMAKIRRPQRRKPKKSRS